MKITALSLWEPWASAMRYGLKRIETRSWHPPLSVIGKPLLICGAKRWTVEQNGFLMGVSREMIQAMQRDSNGVTKFSGTRLTREFMLLGYAACVVKVVSVRETRLLRSEVNSMEAVFGDYSDGRYGWMPIPVNTNFVPFPVIGKQGLFQVELPEGIAA